MTGLEDFIRQSNAIEGIFRTVYPDEIGAHEEFLALPELTVLDVQTFVWNVAAAKPRFEEGLDVRVGSHIAPRGGPAILDALTSLLVRIEFNEITSWQAHVEYETLHPFMDGNGRSGRAIWLWMWIRSGNSLPPLSFLQQGGEVVNQPVFWKSMTYGCDKCHLELTFLLEDGCEGPKDRDVPPPQEWVESRAAAPVELPPTVTQTASGRYVLPVPMFAGGCPRCEDGMMGHVRWNDDRRLVPVHEGVPDQSHFRYPEDPLADRACGVPVFSGLDDAAGDADVQTCPRRMQEFGPWEHKEGLDRWETDRWSTDEAASEEAVRAYEEEHPGSHAASRYWRGPGELPRTCSFCGGVHPDDAARLVREGWEVEGTDKAYKRYLNPPGSRTRQDAFIASIRRHEIGRGVPSVWSPVPPVKLYTMHFDAKQRADFNAALAVKS